MQSMGSICAVLMLRGTEPMRPADVGGPRPVFGLEGRQGGMARTVESTIASFAEGLPVGFTTLKMDVQITKGHVAVITHDRKADPPKCSGQHAGCERPGQDG
jgi:glycerophosphoryl diester phosphodiesterase